MMELNQFEEAIQNFHLAIDLIQIRKLPETFLAVTYSNMAVSYTHLDVYKRQLLFPGRIEQDTPANECVD